MRQKCHFCKVKEVQKIEINEDKIRKEDFYHHYHQMKDLGILKIRCKIWLSWGLWESQKKSEDAAALSWKALVPQGFLSLYASQGLVGGR